jgi:arabinogalactan endo-1,4-beta-galactosidase
MTVTTVAKAISVTRRNHRSGGRVILRLCICLLLCSFTRSYAKGQSSLPGYAVGADISFLKQAEDNGLTFRDAGTVKPGLQILRDHGYNWVRLRVFVDPAKANAKLPNDLAYSIGLATRAKAMGFKVEVGLHYSDTWADRFHQITPSRWQGQSHAELVKSVFAYTRDTVAAFREAGVLPDMMQIGNEPTLGFLWPDGKLPERWQEYAELYQAAIRGIDAGRGTAPRPLILLQLDLGGDWPASKVWLDRAMQYHLAFDIIGQSYYAHDYHSLFELRENLNNTALTYGKDVIVIETSYESKPSKAFPNGDGPFPENPEGQAQFLDEVNRIVMSVPGSHGKGVFWWEPFWPKPGVGRGMVDDKGNMLPVIRVFDKWTGGEASRTHQPLSTPQLTGATTPQHAGPPER